MKVAVVYRGKNSKYIKGRKIYRSFDFQSLKCIRITHALLIATLSSSKLMLDEAVFFELTLARFC